MEGSIHNEYIIEYLGKFVKAYFWPRGYLKRLFSVLKITQSFTCGGAKRGANVNSQLTAPLYLAAPGNASKTFVIYYQKKRLRFSAGCGIMFSSDGGWASTGIKEIA